LCELRLDHAQPAGAGALPRQAQHAHRVFDVVDQPEDEHDVVHAERSRVDVEEVGLAEGQTIRGNLIVIAEQRRPLDVER